MHDKGLGAEREASSRSETPSLSTTERKELWRSTGTRLPLVLVLLSLALAMLLPRLVQVGAPLDPPGQLPPNVEVVVAVAVAGSPDPAIYLLTR